MFKNYIKIELIFSKIFIKMSNLTRISVTMTNIKSFLKEKKKKRERENCKSKKYKLVTDVQTWMLNQQDNQLV
jgi:glutaredoxin-related protein